MSFKTLFLTLSKLGIIKILTLVVYKVSRNKKQKYRRQILSKCLELSAYLLIYLSKNQEVQYN